MSSDKKNGFALVWCTPTVGRLPPAELSDGHWLPVKTEPRERVILFTLDESQARDVAAKQGLALK